jgi:signal transduction histidine kinase
MKIQADGILARHRLGLYVSREIARYHGGDLYLSPETTIHPEALNTFVFELPSEE